MSLKVAIQLNIPLDIYEEMTPYELNLYLEVYEEQYLAKQEERLTEIWVGEYYHRLKKLPPLKRELESLRGKEKQKMSDDEMYRIATLLNNQFKGTTIE